MIIFTLRPLYSGGRSPRLPLDRKLGGLQIRSRGENLNVILCELLPMQVFLFRDRLSGYRRDYSPMPWTNRVAQSPKRARTWSPFETWGFHGVKIQVVVLWVITPYNDEVGYQRFGGSCFLYFILKMDRWYPTTTVHDVITQITTWSQSTPHIILIFDLFPCYCTICA
jgi:hypothetical protein